MMSNLEDIYPISTFKGETQKELIEFIELNYISREEVGRIVDQVIRKSEITYAIDVLTDTTREKSIYGGCQHLVDELIRGEKELVAIHKQLLNPSIGGGDRE